MPLQVSFVERLEDVLEPAREFLARDLDLFAMPRIVVPNAGTKAWLLGELARGPASGRRGAGAAGDCDGIVANVEFSFPGTILAFLQPPPTIEPDRWSFDRLTFAVLDVIAGPAGRTLDIPFDVRSEPLLAARRIAGLFDDYHVRRPEMILQWEGDTPSRAMNPTANDEQRDNEPVPDLLAEQDRWQFELWRLVSRGIAAASPPARASLAHRAPHAPLLVAGLQSLSWPQLRCLQTLAERCDVRALLVHPSPGLRAAWQAIGPAAVEEKLRGRPLRRSRRPAGDAGGGTAAAEPDEPALAEGFDPLPATWLAGARETQDLLVSQAIPLTDGPAAARGGGDTLLHRMQATVASGREPDPQHPGHDPERDHSLVIHRCHSLSRQAEVLHDALLHAFADPRLEGLQPHHVVIVSPCLEEAAPHLEAVFQKTVVGRDAAATERTIRLPLVVADRGLRETSAAVDLLAALVALPGSRCAVDDVIEVASHPLVRPHLGVDDDTVAMWLDLVDRAQVRWGLDHEHRRHRGLEIADPVLRDVHTWKAGLERMLLGAALPDAEPRPELGGVVPLVDLDPADIEPIAKLVRAIDVIGDLAAVTAEALPTTAWCDALETALFGLCGEHCRDLAEPLAEIRRLRDAAAGAAADRTVSFAEVRTLLAEWFEEKAGRQPLRTGAITATSMVPMRGVPFRVVCVIGYDDGAVGGTDPAKDDLVARMPLVGDVDPRVEARRALLDCLLAARDRLVITCTGRSVKTNQPVPLVTPLAELVDFAVRHGVGRKRLGAPSGIEVEHPRHHLGRKNFLPGEVQPGLTWSHDGVAAEVAAAAAAQPSESAAATGPTAESPPRKTATSKPEIDVSMLERFVRDPLELYLRETFQISRWRDDDDPTPATLPLELDDAHIQALTMELVQLLADAPATATSWGATLLASGRLPVGPHGRRQLADIRGLAAGIVARAATLEVPVSGAANPEVRLELANARIVGRLAGVAAGAVTTIKPRTLDKASPGRPLHVAAVQLLVARAVPELAVTRGVVISRNPKWSAGGGSGDPCLGRSITIADDVDVCGRLTTLCDLVLEALAEPRGLFGLHDVADEDRAERFTEFLQGRNWKTGEWLYPRRTEALVYGLSPTYATVFPAASPARAFLDAFRASLRLLNRKGTSGYTLA